MKQPRPNESKKKTEKKIDIPINICKEATVLPTEIMKNKKTTKAAIDIPNNICKATKASPAETETKPKTKTKTKKKKPITFEDQPTRESASNLHHLADLKRLKGLDRTQSEEELHKSAKAKRKKMAEHPAPPPSDYLPPDYPPDDVFPDPPPPMRDKAPQGKPMSLMQPQILADIHPFAATLYDWQQGIQVNCGPNWDLDTCQAAVDQGPHPSAMTPNLIDLFATDIGYQEKAGFCKVFTWEELVKRRPKNLKISPVAVVPQVANKAVSSWTYRSQCTKKWIGSGLSSKTVSTKRLSSLPRPPQSEKLVRSCIDYSTT